MSKRCLPFVALLAALFSTPGAAFAAEPGGYQVPPQVLVDLVDAPATPWVGADPTGQNLFVAEVANLRPIAELASRELKLAGLRFNPRTLGPSRAPSATGLKLLEVASGRQRNVTGLPAGAKLSRPMWSPDGRRLAVMNTVEGGIELWVVEVASGDAKKLTGPQVHQVLGLGARWAADSQSLVVALAPANRGPEPAVPTVPTGPQVQESLGRKSPERTYQDLLKNPSDEALFEYYVTSQLARVGLEGRVTLLGAPAMVRGVTLSPDQRFLLVEQIQRPFSYRVPLNRFPRKVEVWSATDGQVVKTLADIPFQSDLSVAFDSVPRGPRNHEWRSDAPATVVWAEALDDGDATKEATDRDRLLALSAPFSAAPTTLANLGYRYNGSVWGRGDLAVIYEGWWKTRRTRAWIIQPDAPAAAPKAFLDYSSEDRYADPGFPMSQVNASGHPVLRFGDGGKTVYFTGDGASNEGDRPFLDARDVATGKTRRLFQSSAPHYEVPMDLLGSGAGSLLLRRESVDVQPNFFVRDLAKGQQRQLTQFAHPTPQLVGVKKELIRYKRDDGVELTGTLYLPPGYQPSQGPLPLVMWAYPQEFKTAAAASQVTDSPYRFVRVPWGSPLLFLARGYAVLDDPAMPIVGEGDAEPNDTYVQQLVASAKAAVDEVVRRGVAEPGRIAVGGHSYGAFMTANLLAHSDLFAAGIARSGAYNRTLTPFGFQAEERTLWQAPETYATMSPFNHADKLKEPILLVHGEADNNTGTFPIQSDRMYAALQGLGGTVRLVVLPLESHGYLARESILHLLWEQDRWLEQYVKNAKAGK